MQLLGSSAVCISWVFSSVSFQDLKNDFGLTDLENELLVVSGGGHGRGMGNGSKGLLGSLGWASLKA